MNSQKWRYLETGKQSASWNMAVDSLIVKEMQENKLPPTLRLYGWNPPAISLGYFQQIEKEIDVQSCHKKGVDIVRRITGGGTVLHEAELTYSLVIPQDHPQMPSEIIEIFEKICNGVIRGLGHCGIEASFEPINDIIAYGKKISGNAQIRKRGVILQHGTILLDVDVERMFSLLTVSEEKIRDKLIERVEERVTSTRHILGRAIEFEVMLDAVKKGFSEEFDIHLDRDDLTDAEENEIASLAEEKFSSRQWVFKR